MKTPMRASPDQRTRIKTDEGTQLSAYQDTVGIWTVGIGHASTNPRPVRGLRIVYQKDEHGAELRDPITHKLIPVIDENGKPTVEFYQGKVCEGVTISATEQERLFDEDISEIEAAICEAVEQDLQQHQFDALIDFAFQYGVHRLLTSTLLLKLNFNPFNFEVLNQLMRWTMAGGEHREYVWRRSARRAIRYNGTPVPQALYRKNGFPFVVDAETGHIDYTQTPTIQKLIDIGKAKASPPVFDPKAEWPPSDSTESASKLEGEGGYQTAQTPDPASAATAGPNGGVGAQVDPSPPDAPIARPAPPDPNPAPPPVQLVPPGAEEAQASLQPPPQRTGEKSLQAPAPPVILAPPPPRDPVPANVVDGKDMVLSRRFWGLVVTAIGTTNFLPRGISQWAANEGNRELLTWLIVVVVGFGLYKYGQHKATRHLK